VKFLQNENKKLTQKLKIPKNSSSNSLENLAGALYAEEYRTNKKLREQMSKLELDLKLKSNEIEMKEFEINELVSEIEELKFSMKNSKIENFKSFLVE
jgi:hypothetical protein